MNDVLISEAPTALSGWTEAGIDRLVVLDSDIRRLLRDAADARFSAREAEGRVVCETSRRLLGLIQVLDAFDRVFRSMQGKEDKITPQTKIWIGNFRSVRRLVESQLSDEGVVRMQNLAEGFDPRWHTVAQTVHDTDRPQGSIVEEVQPGYFWKNQVLRKAEVTVIKNED